jgi:hypothetical protein
MQYNIVCIACCRQLAELVQHLEYTSCLLTGAQEVYCYVLQKFTDARWPTTSALNIVVSMSLIQISMLSLLQISMLL